LWICPSFRPSVLRWVRRVASPVTWPATGTRVAIVDDDLDEAETAVLEVEEAGFEPFVISQGVHYDKVEELADVIKAEAQAALCDHRLRTRGLANFEGAELAARLFDLGIPNVLITQFLMDSGVSIRRHRDKIPVLLSRGEVDSSKIIKGLQRCLDEMRGEVAADRRPHESLVRVEEVREEAKEPVVDAVVINWNPHQAVRFPLSLVPEPLHAALQPDTWLLAKVNVGADRSEDLYFKDIRLAPDPDPDDGLA